MQKVKLSKSKKGEAYWNDQNNTLNINFSWENPDKNINIRLK